MLPVLRDVEPEEARTATLMFGAVFFVMCAYYMVKPLREGWIATSAIAGLSRVEIKAYSSLVQSLLLVATVGTYARLAARTSQRTLLTRTSLACVAMLIAFWLLQPGFLFTALPGVGIAFYLWVGIFGVFIVAQFWAFATDLYADERGRRLLPLIALGGTSGATAGSWLHGVLTAFGLAGAHAVLLLATVPLLAAAWSSRRVARGVASARAPRPHQPANLRRLVSDRFVLAAGVLALLLSWATTNGENLLFQVVQDGIARGAAAPLDAAATLDHARTATAAFYGDFYFWTNLMALAAQLLLTSRLLARGGLAAIIFVLPLLALLASALLALAPVLALLKWVKVAEQATDYSLNQTARQVLWLPVSAEVKYESKPTVDALFVRLGDGMAALTSLAASHVVGHGTDVMIAVNLVLVLLWLVTTVVVVREHGRLVAARATAAAAAAIHRTMRACRAALRRAARATLRRACRATTRRAWRVPTTWDAWIAERLALLPIGRGHPPPMALPQPF